MPRTALTPITGVVKNPSAGAALVWTAADTSNGNKVALTGKELVLAWNTHATTAYTVTMTSAPDNLGRTKNITAESITAGDIHQLGVPQLEGWRQTDGTLSLDANNAAVKFCVIRLP